MIEIIDGDLFQWDIGRKIKVTPKDDFTVDEIHFCNIKSDTALVYRVYHDGEIVVNIPNILLQSDEDLIIYLVHIDDDFQQTFRRRIFKVHGRAKPSDYVYTDDEVFTYKTLLQEIEKIKNYTVDESKIKKAVDEYMTENPVEVPEVELPENVSAFKNDAGYLTKVPDEYITEKELNDKGFALKEDIPEMPEIPDVPVQSVNGQTGDVKLDAESVGALPKNTKIPANTSDLSNDSGFITKAVNDLANYYLKSETYTQEEIKQLVGSIPKFSIQPVDSLPTTDISATTVYLLKNDDKVDNLYTEYIYVNGAWECLGSQTVDLSGYALSADIPTNLSELVNDVGFITNTVANLVNYYKKDEVYNKDEIDCKGFLTEHQDLSDYAKKNEIPSVPTKNSQLENDSNYISQETDPTVPSWAKQSNKPSYTADEVGADSVGTAKTEVDEHNVNLESHNDIRLFLKELNEKVNHFLDIDDETKDQASEIVALIEDNRDLIEQITTNKVSVTDIIDNLTTNLSNKVLSASMGVELKRLIDSIKVPTKVSELENDKEYLTEHQDISGKLDASKLPEAINTALSQAKTSGEFDGKDGENGKNGIVVSETEPEAYENGDYPVWLNPNGDELSQIATMQDVEDVRKDIPTVPTDISAFTNDKGYLTSLGADYILEIGTDKGWNWEKWNSGKYVCYGTFNDTRNHYTTVNGFYGYYSSDFPYPITFHETPIVHFNCKIGSGFAAPAGDVARSTVQCRCYALSTASGEVPCVWELLVIGRWK